MTIPGRARLMGSEGTEYAMDLGPALVAALADKDWKKKVRAILHPDLQLRGLTPGKFNEATGPNAVADAVGIFELWFYEDTDYLVEVLTCDVSPNGPDGQYKLSYSFRARSEGMSTWHNG